ncbi:MAG: hypothetical protein JNM78_06845 [Cyclobacteriaceae bacterium]|nr:hypothetical protein [Cyclobacteriaceae bacterium]
MNAILKVLIQSLVIPFYKNHAGLLFFVFFIMFGIIESTQVKLYHESLIYGTLTSGIFLIVVLIVWLLYSVKALHFLLKTSTEDSYLFLHNIAVLPARLSFWHFFIIVFLTFIPVFVYTLIIYSIGIRNSFYEVVVLIFLFQLALWFLSAWILNYTARTRHKPVFITLPSLSLPFQQTLLGMYGAYLFKEEKPAIFLSKVCSIVLIYLVKETLEVGDDFRFLAITWMFAMLSHTFLIQKIKVFEDQYLTWTRNLPVARTQTFLMYLQLYAFLMIPEMLLLTGSIGKGLNPLQMILLPLLSSGFLLSIHSYLFKRNRDPDQFVTYLFWLFIGCFMVVLSELVWVLANVLIATSFKLYWTRYYRYERSVTIS